MNAMPQSRLLLYIFGFSVLPILLALLNYWSQSSTLDGLEARVMHLQQAAYMRDRKQAANLLVRAYYKGADRFYIDKQIESIHLLASETKALESAAEKKYMAEDPRITRRLAALAANSLVFSEGMVQSYPYFNEIPESLAHPVEVDVDDIRQILAKVEGVKIGPYEPGPNRPQLVLTDFRLDRQANQGQSEIYSLNLKLIKREFL